MIICVGVIVSCERVVTAIVKVSLTEEEIVSKIRRWGLGGSWQGSELIGGDGRLLAYHCVRDTDSPSD